MSTVAIQGFEPLDFSDLIERERMNQIATRSAPISGSLPFGGGTTFSLSALRHADLSAPTFDVVHAYVAIGVKGVITARHLSFSDSVKEMVFDASASLSPQLRKRITELVNLKLNWDGEGAKPVKPHVLADVVDTLKRLSLEVNGFHEPFLVPTFDGFAQMEWHGGKRSLDIEATKEGWSAVGTEAGLGGKRHYSTAEFARNDFAQLVQYYQWLLGDDLLIWPLL